MSGSSESRAADMNQQGLTPDEKFLHKLYQMAQEKGDLFQEIDAMIVAKAVSLKETALKNIIKHLAQANFLEKCDGTFVKLTKNGCRFVEQ